MNRNPSQLAAAEQIIELGGGDVDKKQNQDPDLDRREVVPGERGDQVRQEAPERMVLDEPEPDELFEQAGDEHHRPIDDGLEQDRLDQRCAIVPANERHGVGNEDRFCDDEGSASREHEVADGNGIVGENQILSSVRSG